MTVTNPVSSPAAPTKTASSLLNFEEIFETGHRTSQLHLLNGYAKRKIACGSLLATKDLHSCTATGVHTRWHPGRRRCTRRGLLVVQRVLIRSPRLRLSRLIQTRHGPEQPPTMSASLEASKILQGTPKNSRMRASRRSCLAGLPSNNRIAGLANALFLSIGAPNCCRRIKLVSAQLLANAWLGRELQD